MNVALELPLEQSLTVPTLIETVTIPKVITNKAVHLDRRAGLLCKAFINATIVHLQYPTTFTHITHEVKLMTLYGLVLCGMARATVINDISKNRVQNNLFRKGILPNFHNHTIYPGLGNDVEYQKIAVRNVLGCCFELSNFNIQTILSCMDDNFIETELSNLLKSGKN